MERMTVIRGMVKKTLPAESKVHGVMKSWSLALASAARRLATLLSNSPKSCSRDVARSGLNGGAPAGAESNCSVFNVFVLPPTRSARGPAHRPRGLDHSLGLKSRLSL